MIIIIILLIILIFAFALCGAIYHHLYLGNCLDRIRELELTAQRNYKVSRYTDDYHAAEMQKMEKRILALEEKVKKVKPMIAKNRSKK